MLEKTITESITDTLASATRLESLLLTPLTSSFLLLRACSPNWRWHRLPDRCSHLAVNFRQALVKYLPDDQQDNLYSIYGDGLSDRHVIVDLTT